MAEYRSEHDLVGECNIPVDAYYGVHTARAVENFPITGRKLPEEMIKSIAWIKKACAIANCETGALNQERAEAIEKACDEIIEGKLHDQFLTDPVQGGAGTSTNMNANEVIANRAIELLGGRKGDYKIVNPNDHVNCSQSTNDVYPSTIKMTLFSAMERLIAQVSNLVDAFDEKAAQFDNIVKMGRTQLQDAVPIRLGQEFAAYSAVLMREMKRLQRAQHTLLELNLGGTAIGTGMNASKLYISKVVVTLADITGIPFVQNADLIDGTQNLDCYTTVSGALKSCAVSISKICNDLRLMSSGPRDGLAEIVLPPRQNGSSIMPGKINPVIPEVVNQIAFRIVGFDVTVAMAVEAGQLELNAFEHIIFDSLYQGVNQLANGIGTLIEHCVKGIRANETACTNEVERTIGIVTALSPFVGYQTACHLATDALKSGRSIRELALEKKLMDPDELDKALDPIKMTEPAEE